ncbi:2858_t:CDS:2 [Funneliformis geosporum]|nr:2858_t:CDS:2 [Funneliformis geosporum]
MSTYSTNYNCPECKKLNIKIEEDDRIITSLRKKVIGLQDDLLFAQKEIIELKHELNNSRKSNFVTQSDDDNHENLRTYFSTKQQKNTVNSDRLKLFFGNVVRPITKNILINHVENAFGRVVDYYKDQNSPYAFIYFSDEDGYHAALNQGSILVEGITVLTTNAQLKGKWPEVDKPPPVDATWTSLVDMSKVPKAPLSKGENDCPANDEFCKWSCTQCTRNDSDIVVCPNTSATKDVKLTFFVIGSRVIENPQILQKAFNAGHLIGVHTWSHSHLTQQSNEEIIAEIKWTEEAIKQAVGVTPKYMRPPFGDCDDRVRGILTQLGYKIVMWDKDTNDYLTGEDKNFKAEWIEGNFTQWVKEPSTTGHISLEHDLYQPSAARASYVVPIVQGAGFLIKPVSVCVDDPKPYVEDVSLTPVAKTPTVETPTVETPAAQVPKEDNPQNDVPTESPVSQNVEQPADTTPSIAISLTNNNNLLLLIFLITSGQFDMNQTTLVSMG